MLSVKYHTPEYKGTKDSTYCYIYDQMYEGRGKLIFTKEPELKGWKKTDKYGRYEQRYAGKTQTIQRFVVEGMIKLKLKKNPEKIFNGNWCISKHKFNTEKLVKKEYVEKILNQELPEVQKNVIKTYKMLNRGCVPEDSLWESYKGNPKNQFKVPEFCFVKL